MKVLLKVCPDYRWSSIDLGGTRERLVKEARSKVQLSGAAAYSEVVTVLIFQKMLEQLSQLWWRL